LILVLNDFSKSIKYVKKTTANKSYTQNNIKYSLNFKSIIAPSSITNLKLLLNKKNSNKELIKQSYLMLTWFYYISSKSFSGNKNSTRPSFFIKPRSTSKFTMTKAPMAHKTFSQEQYMFKFFSLSMSFDMEIGKDRPSLNSSLYLSQFIRNSSTFFETNLFFLQKIKINLPSKERNFFYVI